MSLIHRRRSIRARRLSKVHSGHYLQTEPRLIQICSARQSRIIQDVVQVKAASQLRHMSRTLSHSKTLAKTELHLVQRRKARKLHLTQYACQIKGHISVMLQAKSHSKMQAKTESCPTHAMLKPRLRGSGSEPTNCQSARATIHRVIAALESQSHDRARQSARAAMSECRHVRVVSHKKM